MTLSLGCALLTPPLTTFPEDRGGPSFAVVKAQMAQAFEREEPSLKARRIAVQDPGWQLERHPVTGLAVRRVVAAHVGYQSIQDPSRCGVDDLSFTQESLGPDRWADLRVYGVATGSGKRIACEALGKAPAAARTNTAAAARANTAAAPANASAGDAAPVEAPPDAPPAAAFLATRPEGIPDGAQAGEVVARTLDGFQPFAIDGKRGQCYAVRVALDRGAALSAHARKMLHLAYRTADREITAEPRMLGRNIAPAQRAFDAKVGCPQQSAPIEMDLQATSMSAARPGHLHELGAGPIQFQVYTWAISDVALKANVVATQRAIQQARQSGQQFTAATCAGCRREKDECLDKKARGLTDEDCVSVFDSCVFRSGLGPGGCKNSP